jgi:hypothetical protein
LLVLCALCFVELGHGHCQAEADASDTARCFGG